MKRKRKNARSRLHSDDARMLRDLLLTLHSSLNELEVAVGQIQSVVGISGERMGESDGPLCEILEVA